MRDISCKWPGLLVEGQDVTPDQAAEILVRTHTWPCFSNNRSEQRKTNALFGLTDEWSEKNEILLERAGVLDLEYLGNSMVTSCWLWGLKGWCDWEGRIGCSHFNIGKWPCNSDVTEDLEAIAAAFPFLEMRVQVLSGEIGEERIYPTAEWLVSGGQVSGPLTPGPQISGSRGWVYRGNCGPMDRIERGVELTKERGSSPPFPSEK
jgi:hypothetical protein